MAAKIDGIKPPFVPIGIDGLPSTRRPIPSSGSGPDFHDILLEKLGSDRELKFSAHARNRIQSRNIPLTAENIQQLVKAVELAEQKGARDSLILMENLAFIVNIGNRTVITAMDGESMKENVFTNIDSAIIVK